MLHLVQNPFKYLQHAALNNYFPCEFYDSYTFSNVNNVKFIELKSQ